jgi:segregation and condensation protein A
MIKVTTEKFQGPFGILLQLIEQEKMDITDIALARIADDYVQYLEANPDISTEEMADFLVIAAKLLYLKSKALLPYLLNEEEEEEISDLENRLKLYKEFVDASRQIAALIATGRFQFSPVFNGKNFNRLPKEEIPAFNPPKNLTADILKQSLEALIAVWEKQEKKLEEKRLEPKISIDERISHIRQLLKAQTHFSFSEFLRQATSRTEIIVNFLAVLELAKQRELTFEQSELFSEIEIIKRGD